MPTKPARRSPTGSQATRRSWSPSWSPSSGRGCCSTASWSCWTRSSGGCRRRSGGAGRSWRWRPRQRVPRPATSAAPHCCWHAPTARGCSLLAAPRLERFAQGRAVVELLLGRVGGDVERTTRAGALLTVGARGRALAADARAATADGLRVAALAQLGAVEVWCGRLETGERRLEAATAAARERELPLVALLAQAQLALAGLLAGRLVRAAERARAALTIAERRGLERTAAAATAQAVLAATLLHWERREEAERLLRRAERTVRPLGERPLRAFVAQQRIELLIADGAWDAGGRAAAGGAGGAGEWPLAPALRAALRRAGGPAAGGARRARGGGGAAARRLRARAAARACRRAGAAAAGRRRAGAGERGGHAVAGRSRRCRARSRSSCGRRRRSRARRSTIPPAPAPRSSGRSRWPSPTASGTSCWRSAPAVRAPLRRAIRAGTAHRSFAGELLDALERDEQRPLPLPEPLSEREEAVLRCLPTMMSNREIAGELYVSVNTVKTHLKHIYRKLDAADRRAAVRRARGAAAARPGARAGRRRACGLTVPAVSISRAREPTVAPRLPSSNLRRVPIAEDPRPAPPLPALPNLRDAGGLPTGDGGRVRSGLLYRSGQLERRRRRAARRLRRARRAHGRRPAHRGRALRPAGPAAARHAPARRRRARRQRGVGAGAAAAADQRGGEGRAGGPRRRRRSSTSSAPTAAS